MKLDNKEPPISKVRTAILHPENQVGSGGPDGMVVTGGPVPIQT